MKYVLMFVLLIIGMVVEGKLSRGFIKLMKHKLTPIVFYKYRCWIAEGAFLISAFILAIILVVTSIINGAGIETFYFAPKACLILFACFNVFGLFRLLAEKRKSPIVKLYDKHHLFTASEAIHALEPNEKEILMQKFETFPTDLQEYLSSIMTSKMRKKHLPNYKYDEFKTKSEGLSFKLETGQPFSKEEIDTINLVMRINKYSNFKYK